MSDPRKWGQRLREALGGGNRSAKIDATPGGSTPEDGVPDSGLPENLDNWVDRMADQSPGISREDVIRSDAFEEFASGYGFDVDSFRDRFLGGSSGD